ncbi:type II toxin-antitoxin system CcdA family antitoxin [Entomobacter blattae]|uniref:Post-segregation antitoxin CcdA n=1 Tax=Entomobacter blattae TaxID=2762277 RepID=A0A7H1NRP9_9PROT|nr:type II toxin-antitoxin system CcdA family antitoxin [Entomobacter blattae]QNT78459.1 Post-segregation antitoxin CcdA [Entomobacter blattae]
MPRITSGSRQAANVTLPVRLLKEAKQLGINLSRACENGLAQEVSRLRRQQWLQHNAPAIKDWNEKVDKEGLPLDEYRQF